LTPKELVHPSNELTAIGCVSEDDAQPAEPSRLLDHELGPLTILNGCRVNHGHQDQAKGIDKKVAFSPLHLLSSIKAAFSGLVSHFNALSVEMVAFGAFGLFYAPFPKGIVNALPNSASANWQSNNRPLRHPGKSCGKYLQGQPVFVTYMIALKNLPPLIPWWPTQPAPLWQIPPNSYPFRVAYVAVLLLSVLHPRPCSKPFALVQAFSLTLFTRSQIRYLLLSAIPSAPRLSQSPAEWLSPSRFTWPTPSSRPGRSDELIQLSRTDCHRVGEEIVALCIALKVRFVASPYIMCYTHFNHIVLFHDDSTIVFKV
jgi:hypothetical protein